MRMLLHAMVLATAMFVFSAVVVGFSQQYLQIVAIVMWPALLVLGFAWQRLLCRSIRDSAAVLGAALLFFHIALVLLVLLFGDGTDFPGLLTNTAVMAWVFYVPWFWLPWMIGTALGGIRFRRRRPPNQSLVEA